MKEFRFFDCALLNITHPTKAIDETMVMKNTTLTQRETAPMQVFPPDHSVLDNVRSSNIVQTVGTDIIQSINKTFNSVHAGRTGGRNRIISETGNFNQRGSTINGRRLPSVSRNSSVYLGKVQTRGKTNIPPRSSHNLSAGTVKDRSVVISKRIVNLTSDANSGQSNADTKARITMIDVQDGITSGGNANSAEVELNGAASMQDHKIKEKQLANKEMGIDTIKDSSNFVESSSNKSVDFINFFTDSSNFSNSFGKSDTVLQRNATLNMSNDFSRNLTIEYSRQHGAYTENNKKQTKPNQTVDWKILRNDSQLYYDDAYYYYNDTGAYNDSYYVFDDVYNYNETFVNNVADTTSATLDVTSEHLINQTGNTSLIHDNTNNSISPISVVNNISVDRNDNSDINSGINNFGESVVTNSDTKFNVNIQVSSINKHGNNRSAGFNEVKNSDTGIISVANKKGRNSPAVNELGTNITTNNKRRQTSVIKSSLTLTGVSIKTNEADVLSNPLGESYNTSQNFLKDQRAVDKNRLINETVQMIEDLTDRPVTRVKSVNTIDKTLINAVNKTGINGFEDLNSARINQQIVEVPNRITVLPKYDIILLNDKSPVQAKKKSALVKKDSVSNSFQTLNKEDITYAEVNPTNKGNNSFTDFLYPVSKSTSHVGVFDTRLSRTNTKNDKTVWLRKSTLKTFGDAADSNLSNSVNNIHVWESPNSTALRDIEMDTLEKDTISINQAEPGSSSPGYHLTKKLSYPTSAADRRPHNANTNTIKTSLEISPAIQDVETIFNLFETGKNSGLSENTVIFNQGNQTSGKSFHKGINDVFSGNTRIDNQNIHSSDNTLSNRMIGIFSETNKMLKPIVTSTGFLGRQETTNADRKKTGTANSGSQEGLSIFQRTSFGSSQSRLNALESTGDTRYDLNTQSWGSQPSDMDIPNKLFDRISSPLSELITNYQTTTLAPMQESSMTTDSTVMLDVSTRAYDQYIGLPSTTIEPLNTGSSTFVRLVNYSTVTADSVFPAPVQDISTFSDLSTSASSTRRTESSLMSIFSSTLAPRTIKTTPGEFNKTFVFGNTFAENTLNENLNFFVDSDTTVDHLGGVPIANGATNKDVGQWDSPLIISQNDLQKGMTERQFKSFADFDISNTLEGSRNRRNHKTANEVIWKPVKGYAVPVGNLSIDPNLQTGESVRDSVSSSTDTVTHPDLLKSSTSMNQDKFIYPTISRINNTRHKKRKNISVGNAIIWQSMLFSNLSKPGGTESRMNLPLPTQNDLKTNRILDISINGNAVINKISATKSEGTPTLFNQIKSTPAEMPPIKIETQTPEISRKFRNVAVSNIESEISPASQKMKRNITLFTPYLTSDSNKSKLEFQRIRNTFSNRRPQVLQNTKIENKNLSETVFEENKNLSGEKIVSSNLSVSSIWDINRRNTSNTIQNKSDPRPNRPISEVTDQYTVYSHDSSNSDLRYSTQTDGTPVNFMRDSSNAIAVQDRSSNDVNTQVLRTFEALVLELKEMETKAKKTRKPVVDSSVYNTQENSENSAYSTSNMKQDGTLSSYPVFSVHPNLLKLSNNNTVNRLILQRNDGRVGASRNNKLLNMLGISDQRDWNSDISFNTSFGADNIQKTADSNSSTQQIVHLTEAKSKPAEQFASLLNAFADLSRAQANKNTDDPSVITEHVQQSTDIANSSSAQTESRGQTNIPVPTDVINEGSAAKKQQTVIQGTNITFHNPFTGENILFSRPGEKTAEKFIVRGIGNLRNLEGVESLYSANFTPDFPIAHYDFAPSSDLSESGNVLSIEGKYLYGQMRRNDMGQFEPVPIASNFDASLAEKTPSPKTTLFSKEGITTKSSVVTVKAGSSLAGILKHSVDNKLREKPALPTNVRQTTDLPVVSFASGSERSFILESDVLNERTNNNEPLWTAGGQDIAVNGSDSVSTIDHLGQPDQSNNIQQIISLAGRSTTDRNQPGAGNGKMFFNQDDLLKTNNISINQLVRSSLNPIESSLASLKMIETSEPRLDIKKNILSCKRDEIIVCNAVGKNRHIPGMVWWCFSHCKNGVCPPEKCSCRCQKERMEHKLNSTTSEQISKTKRRKKVIELTLNSPVEAASPVSEDQNRTSVSKSMLSRTARPEVLNAPFSSFEQTRSSVKNDDRIEPIQLFETPTVVKCKGINAFANTTGIDKLCTRICSQNMCPKSICECK